jgi:hypothetical protein
MRHLFCATAAVLGVIAAGCSSQKATPPPAASAGDATTNHTRLLGDMKPVVSVKELMQYMIDPAGDYIFDSVKTFVQPDGKIVEVEPKTDEDWEKLKIGAVTLAEGVYLLKVERPFTPPGDRNNSVGEGATELTPEQIAAKVNKDPVEWNARIEALRNVGLEVLDIVKRKNTKELWDASENLDEACEACHRSYWYPKEDQTFYRDLDRRLRDLPTPKTFSPAPTR